MSLRTSVALFFVLVATAVASSPEWVVVERVRATPATLTTTSPTMGWTRGPRPAASMPVELRVFLHLQHADQLEHTAYAVSDPTNALYGQHWTRAQVDELIAPAPEAIEAVMEYFGRAQLVSRTDAGDILTFLLPVRTVEARLRTTYFTHTHTHTGAQQIACEAYALPASIAQYVAFAGPTVRLPTLPLVHTPKTQQAFGGVTPKFLRQIYQADGYSASASRNASLQLAGFLGQYISLSDLKSFYSQLDPQSVGRSPPTIHGQNGADTGIEAQLDIEYGSAMAAGVPRISFWSTGGTRPGGNEPWLAWLQDLASTDEVADVLSASYGDNEPTIDITYAFRVQSEFQKLAARGITLLVASGDGGVAGGQPSLCTKFIPTFPAANPWTTSVGGTTSSAPEVAAGLSAGGFSNFWARPQYQVDAVKTYMAEAQQAGNLPASTLFNQTGAGFPDVAAQAENFVIVLGGFEQPVSGTSCASPTFAGLVAMLNDARKAVNKPPLGYLNPLFYSHPEGFHDITSGNNPGCFTNGFSAAKGWDPITGMGSMNFGAMKKIVESA